IADVEAIAQSVIDTHESTSETGKIGWAAKPYFGVEFSVTNPRNEWDDEEAKNKLIVKETVKIASVAAAGAADAGIGAGKFNVGDEISAVKIIRGGETVKNVTINTGADFRNAILYARQGDTVEITVIRSGAKQTLRFENLQQSDFEKIK
ncbi:MAG: PDZ domain-containing protein, partial [Candidatus Scatosoma sp.]